MKLIHSTVFRFVLLSLVLALGACSSDQTSHPSAADSTQDTILPHSKMLVQNLLAEEKELKNSATPDVSTAHSVKVTLVVNRDALFNQEFLYGADLQYSSSYDSSMDLYSQSLVGENIPVKFRIAGEELQLVADNRRLYPSDVNHPEQIISRFKILRQDEQTLTITGADSRFYLAALLESERGDSRRHASHSLSPQDFWIRSTESDVNGTYILQQTSVQAADGTIAEFMESIFPRSEMDLSNTFEKFEMNPDSLVGGVSGEVARFRFLSGEATFSGERKRAYAQHFDIGSLGTIDWYVTPNISDEDLPPVQEAVEAWNRYFIHYKGIERAVLRFKGKLPAGIHLGDPRYNVISWDSRLVAGAAYESQASDPQTGKQSHSLIYMPAAWLKIGADYWTKGRFSDRGMTPSLPETETTGTSAQELPDSQNKNFRTVCYKDLRAAAAHLNSGRLTAPEAKVFGIQILKQTLFHEVGHALGLHHNFKGSLSFNRNDPYPVFSSSIMDYNDFEIERGAFYNASASEGPQLEYDRQALSALYNHGRDISGGDDVLPACNDAEADETEGGVDPLCNRYDIEKDPTHSIETAFARIQKPSLERDVTLREALMRVTENFGTAERLSNIKTVLDLLGYLQQYSDNIAGSIKFYVTVGNASVLQTVTKNIKALLVFNTELTGYNELEMRERSFEGIRKALAMNDLPPVVKSTISGVQKKLFESLGKAPYFNTLKKDEQANLFQTAKELLAMSLQNFNDSTSDGLPGMRAMILSELYRRHSVPYFFGKIESSRYVHKTFDFETSIISLLEDHVLLTARTTYEREIALRSLTTFKGRLEGDRALSRVQKSLTIERTHVKNSDGREAVESLLEILNAS